MPICATYSADGAYIVCGSDDGQVYVWDGEAAAGRSVAAAVMGRKKVASSESFQVHLVQGPSHTSYKKHKLHLWVVQ